VHSSGEIFVRERGHIYLGMGGIILCIVLYVLYCIVCETDSQQQDTGGGDTTCVASRVLT
jgi:hypothetical protein